MKKKVFKFSMVLGLIICIPAGIPTLGFTWCLFYSRVFLGEEEHWQLHFLTAAEYWLKLFTGREVWLDKQREKYEEF